VTRWLSVHTKNSEQLMYVPMVCRDLGSESAVYRYDGLSHVVVWSYWSHKWIQTGGYVPQDIFRLLVC